MSGEVIERAKALLEPDPCTECGADHSSIMRLEIRDMLADLVPELVSEIERLQAQNVIMRARIETIKCLSSANANASHVIGDGCREKAWLDILAIIEQEWPRG